MYKFKKALNGVFDIIETLLIGISLTYVFLSYAPV